MWKTLPPMNKNENATKHSIEITSMKFFKPSNALY